MSLNISSLFQQRVLLIGGKGGVGKTTVAAALALRASQTQRVLLVSTDPAHSLADVFGRSIGAAIVHLTPNLYALELDPEKEVDAYLDRVLAQMRRFAGPDQIHELQRHLRLSRLSPGAQEAALLERMANLLDTGLDEYDLIIFDTAPTGHTLRLLSLPEIIAVWTDGLLKHNQRSEQLAKVLSHLTPQRDVAHVLSDPHQNTDSGLDSKSQELASTLLARQRLFHRARRILHDATQSAFVFVLTPERLPVLETDRAVQALTDIGVQVAGLVINRVLPPTLGEAFWQSHLQRQQTYLADIQQRFAGYPLRQLPLQDQEIVGLDALHALGDQLST